MYISSECVGPAAICCAFSLLLSLRPLLLSMPCHVMQRHARLEGVGERVGEWAGVRAEACVGDGEPVGQQQCGRRRTNERQTDS